MSFAVLHVIKVKSSGDARRLAGHNDRSHPPSNADPDRSIQWLLPDPETDAWDRIQARVNELPNAMVRANSVMAMSVILSASPEYFGDWKEGDAKTNAWIASSMQWLKDEFGDLVTGAWAHYDEKTPHIHAHIIPGTKDGRLSAKQRFGRIALRAYQTGYALSVSHLGIRRGIAGSKARHTTTKQWYSDRDRVPEYISIPAPPLTGREQWAADLHKRLMGHEKDLVDAAQGRHLAEERAREMTATAEAKEAELTGLRQAQSRLMDIDLCDVLERSGWAHDPVIRDQWVHPYGSVSGAVNLVETKWYDRAISRGGHGAIDLVMHLHGFGKAAEAVGWIKDEFGDRAAEGAYRARALRLATKAVELAPSPYRRPQAEPKEVSALEQWLVRIRKIRADLAQAMIQAGAVFARRRGKWLDAIWPFGHNQGAEVDGIDNPGQSLAPGSRPTRDFWRCDTGPNPSRLVVAETPIDAASFHQVHPWAESTLASTAGTKAVPPEGLQELAKAYSEVIVAYGRDGLGAGCGPNLAKWLGGEYQPPAAPAMHWNDVLIQAEPGHRVAGNATPVRVSPGR